MIGGVIERILLVESRQEARCARHHPFSRSHLR